MPPYDRQFNRYSGVNISDIIREITEPPTMTVDLHRNFEQVHTQVGSSRVRLTDIIGPIIVITEYLGAGIGINQNSYRVCVIDTITRRVISSLLFPDEEVAVRRHLHTAEDFRLGERQPQIVLPTAVTCPLCNGPMKLKEGPFGSFYGCTKWPTCEGLCNIEGEPNKKTQALMRAQPIKESKRTEAVDQNMKKRIKRALNTNE